MASDLNKPDGQAVITPKNGPAFIERLPVKKFHGVGPSTAEKMHRLGIETGADLKARTDDFLSQYFGKSGAYFYGIARGVDTREVQPDRERKSVGAEDTFPEDLFDLEAAREQLLPLVSKVCRFCFNNDTGGKTVTLKVKYSDFQTITRSRTSQAVNRTEASVWQVLEPLLQSVFPTGKVYGCSASACPVWKLLTRTRSSILPSNLPVSCPDRIHQGLR